jgi:integrase
MMEASDRLALLLGAARRAASQANSNLRAGGDPRQDERGLRTLIDRYLAHHVADKRPKTQGERRRHLLRDWGPYHARPAASLTRADLARHKLKLKAEHGPIAANRSAASLRAALTWAVDQGLLDTVPPFPRMAKGEERGRDRVLSLDELRAIWAATAGGSDHDVIVRLLMLSGQRREEVGGMRWAELDLERGLWSLPGSRTKNGRAHQVPLSRQAVALLGAREGLPGREYVFGEAEGSFSGWSRCKRRLDARSGVSGWTLHDLRRSFVTHLAELGISPHVIEAAVNHVSGHKGGIAGVYNRAVYGPEKARATQAWADHLLASEPAKVIPLRSASIP